jgi:glycosyltransferase domain-containing protein
MGSQLTIILTLKDRVAFTYRWMQYMNDIRCPFIILIADGGRDSTIETNLSNYSNYPHLNYEYIRYPVDNDLSSYYQKLFSIVGKVTTPYVIFADNDDFFILDYFSSFIDFLDEQPDYVSCGGESILLELLKENITVNTPGSDKYLATRFNVLSSVTADSVAGRISYFFENVEDNFLWWAWYNVQRTSVIKKAFSILESFYFADILAFEIHLHMTLLSAGKYKSFDLPFYIRQSGTSQSVKELSLECNIIERFIIKELFIDIKKSINSLPIVFTEEEKETMYCSLAKWISQAARALHTESTTRGQTRGAFKKWLFTIGGYGLFNLARWTVQTIRNLHFSGRRTFVKLPQIEKYIIQEYSS